MVDVINTVPQIPLAAPVLDDKNHFTPAWQRYLTQQFNILQPISDPTNTITQQLAQTVQDAVLLSKVNL